MRRVLLVVLSVWIGTAVAQNSEPKPKPDEKKKPPARVTLKPKGGTGSSVGDDAPGGGPRSAEPSKGGTPGTPSGSVTGSAPRP